MRSKEPFDPRSLILDMDIPRIATHSIWASDLAASHKLVLLYFVSSGSILRSKTYHSQRVGMSLGTFGRVTKDLQDAGLIAIVTTRNDDGGLGYNEYFICKRVLMLGGAS